MTEQRRVPIGQGQLAVRVSGAGEPVVLLHPLATSGRLWAPLAARLAADFQVFAVDLRGHGRTSWDGAEFTVEDLADDLAQGLDALGLDAVHLLGMSMGGSVAMTFAGRYPTRVRSLVLADTTAWYGEKAPRTWAARAEQAATTPRADQLAFQVDRWFSESFRDSDPAEVRRVSEIFLATDSAAHAAACRMFGRMDVRALLPAITAPTLALVGEEDYATPPTMAEAVAAHVPEAALLVLPGLRHMALIEAPDLADIVRAHLRADHHRTGGVSR